MLNLPDIPVSLGPCEIDGSMGMLSKKELQRLRELLQVAEAGQEFAVPLQAEEENPIHRALRPLAENLKLLLPLFPQRDLYRGGEGRLGHLHRASLISAKGVTPLCFHRRKIGRPVVDNQDSHGPVFTAMCRECIYDAALAARCSERRAELVRSQYLFSDLTNRQLEEVFRRMTVLELEADDWLFFQNDVAKHFFLVEEGELALLRHSAEGEEVIVAIVGPGETFSEEVVFLDRPRQSVGCRALTPCSVISFDPGALGGLLGESKLSRKLLTTLHRRNQILVDEIEQRALQSATDRLLSFLVKEAGGGDRGERVSLAYPKRALASRLSIKPETLSRILARLRDCSLLEVDGNEIVLTQPAALRESLECESCSRRFWGCPGYLARLEASERSRLPVFSGDRPSVTSAHGWKTDELTE